MSSTVQSSTSVLILLQTEPNMRRRQKLWSQGGCNFMGDSGCSSIHISETFVVTVKYLFCCSLSTMFFRRYFMIA